MLNHIEKSIKIEPTSFQKQVSKQCSSWIDFRANLAPFWDGFGDQNRIQNRFKIDLKIDHKINQIWYRYFVDFGAILGPKMAPKSIQNR